MDERNLYGTASLEPPRARRSITGVLLGVLLAFLIGGGGTAYAVHRWDRVAQWLHPVAPPAPVIVTRTVTVPAPAAPAVPALTERVDAIEDKVDAIDQRAAEASGDADRAERLLVAFAARRALDRGQPLGYLEGMLRDRFGGDDAASVALIIAAAQKPVMLAQLQDGLAVLAPTLTTTDPRETWWTAFRRELASLVVVRRTDGPSLLPVDRLARASHALEQGEVEIAATEVARTPGAARAADWLAAARRYVTARNALDRIETDALLKPPQKPAPFAG
ncbi:hypothetical protein [Sphingomonas nostoxanthinifaciens]|uniref:hypothetical protein n=1 Tax=Sphingomonas nostoxanthinifaciens TaxID=2872652 RepID=UPI001CC21A6F|nr:hypothetical protein [Sphingomonas nostoxanthinifaciens]UAK24400.1 hypothetical protein K8P63_19155 [Sphingomonas nostoxanthinifaciens]